MSGQDERNSDSCSTDGTSYRGAFKGHYDELATSYDKFYKFQHFATVQLIKQYIPLTKTSQIIDIGGGTGQLIELLRQEHGIEKPGVCVEPNLKMLQIAMKKDGIISIQSTADEFLAAKPKFPMELVLMCSCAHHFKDLAEVFANLARHMPNDGVCLLTQYYPPANISFKACVDKYKYIQYARLNEIFKSNNFNHKYFNWKEPMEMDKQFWYETLRGRYSSSLSDLTDEEIEEGIHELEMKFGSDKTLKFEVVIDANIITKQRPLLDSVAN